MKKYLIALLCFYSTFVFADISVGAKEVEVKKISQDLYETKDNKIFIKTRYCYESAYSYEDAILRIDSKYSYNMGKLIFKKGKTCDIEKVYIESH